MGDNIAPAIIELAALQETTVWADPDLSVFNEGRRKPPQLPLEAFPLWGDWIAQCAKQSSAPPDFVALGTLLALSALLANGRWVSPWDGWTEPAVLWGACVGNPSSGKTPALRPIFEILRRIETDMVAIFDDQRRRYEADLAVAKVIRETWQDEVKTAVKNGVTPPLPPSEMDVTEPECPRIKVNDTTVERLASRLAARPKGLLLVRDELSGWLGNLDKYGAGDRGFWIEAYSGGDYIIDRVKHGNKPVHVPYLSVGVMGGIQPDKIDSALFRGDDDGLASRFLMAWPEPQLPTRPTGAFDLGFAETAFRKINDLQMIHDEFGNCKPAYVRMSDKAADLFHQWRIQIARRETDVAGLMLSHVGKAPGMTARLSLILQYMRWAIEGGPEPQHIDETSVGAAAHLMGEYFLPMAERVYGDAALPDDQRNAATMAKAIRKRRVSTINSRTVRREWALPRLREASDISKAIAYLTDADVLRPTPSREGGGPGRVKEDFAVNPKFIEACK